MQHIDDHRVPPCKAERAQRGRRRAGSGPDTFAPEQPGQKVPAPEQEQPGDQREIIGRGKPPKIRQTQPEPVRGVERFGQADKPQAFKPEIAVWQLVGQRKEGGANGQPGGGRHSGQRAAQRPGQQQRAADQMQHAEPDRLAGHRGRRDQREHRRAECRNQPMPQHRAGQRGAEPGQQKKAPADVLLPDMAARRRDVIPGRRQAEDVDPVVHCMVNKHIQKRQPPQRIQLPQAGGEGR